MFVLTKPKIFVTSEHCAPVKMYAQCYGLDIVVIISNVGYVVAAIVSDSTLCHYTDVL